MKKMIRVFSLLLIVASMFSVQFAMPTSAATKTSSYNCDKTVTMTVKTTKKNAKMKFVCKADKKTGSYGAFIKKTYKHTCRVAPKMVIKVSPAVNGKSVYYLQGSGKSISSTLKFDKVGTYTVTVSYFYNKCNECPMGKNNADWFHNYVGDCKDYCDGSWNVSSSSYLDISKIRVK